MSERTTANTSGGSDVQQMVTLKVRVQPGASRTEVLGFRGDVLRVRVAAPPERGKANDAVVALLARVLGTTKGRIQILRGYGSRDKLVQVEGLSAKDVQHAVAQI